MAFHEWRFIWEEWIETCDERPRLNQRSLLAWKKDRPALSAEKIPTADDFGNQIAH